MSFEVKFEDLAGRVGRLKLRRVSLETPALLPVVNPRRMEFPPEKLWEIGFKGLTTNAYILWRTSREKAAELGVHRFLGFQGAILTDSGAYQMLQYGEVEVDPLEIARYQCELGSDMAVILDVPTGWDASRKRAEKTVEETLRRGRETLQYVREVYGEENPLWVGPIQGGTHLDLVAYAARETAKLPFDIYALGSPTGVMEAYQFDVLAGMVMAAKANLLSGKPFHLFGAGHPFMFALAVALGCDLFDSAAYAIYARDGRYITEHGTVRVERLRFLPCHCPACRKTSIEDLRELPSEERTMFLMEHNLYACLSEVERVKQSLAEGRLWEHLEVRARSHPALLQALKRLAENWRFLERGTPRWKSRGLLIFDELSLGRPEVQRVKQSLLEDSKRKRGILLLLPEPEVKPYIQDEAYGRILETLADLGLLTRVEICFYNPVFGLTPANICEVYPFSQFEVTKPPSRGMLESMVDYLARYVEASGFERVILHPDPNLLSREEASRIRAVLTGWEENPWSGEALENLRRTLASVKAEGLTWP
ncbi:MAG: tRNA guanosine(15) transglycosylase TgtA [Candidatus Hecatellales archaeon]|nr:MAG: tRNA guanosine(15) transglycosylase TgtA [Candidatus Hecatellales archaeon]